MSVSQNENHSQEGCEHSHYKKRGEENIFYFSVKQLLSFLFSAPDHLALIEYNQEVKLLIFQAHLLVPIQCWGRKLQGSLFLIAYYWAAKRRGMG